MSDKKIFEKFSVVIPAYNEALTIAYVITQALKVKELEEVIVVNDGGTDSTEEQILPFKNDSRFVYVKHKQNKGKGAALRTGLKKAKNEVVLFLDADLKNITSIKIRKIVLPVLEDKVDVSRGTFKLARGRVTEIAVKPMMKILFPDIYFEQPISGQVCAKKNFLESVSWEDRWGVDIGILLDAIAAGQRVVEVNIGEIKHKGRPLEEKAEMAKQVLETMIKKAGLINHKYKLVAFTLDNTLIQAHAIKTIFEKIGIGKEVKLLQDKLKNDEISFANFNEQVALLFKNISLSKIELACDKVTLADYSDEVVKALKRRKYQVGLISSNFSPIVASIAKRLKIDLIDCIYLEEKNGVFSGKILIKSKERWLSPYVDNPFEKAFQRILYKSKVKSSETIIVANSPKCLPLFSKAGLSIAYRPEDPLMKEVAVKTIKILPEILAIIE